MVYYNRQDYLCFSIKYDLILAGEFTNLYLFFVFFQLHVHCFLLTVFLCCSILAFLNFFVFVAQRILLMQQHISILKHFCLLPKEFFLGCSILTFLISFVFVTQRIHFVQQHISILFLLWVCSPNNSSYVAIY